MLKKLFFLCLICVCVWVLWQIQHDWTFLIREIINKSSRVEILVPSGSEWVKVFEEPGHSFCEDVMNKIRINQKNPYFKSQFPADIRLRFYKNNQIFRELSLHEGRIFRLLGSFRTDGTLYDDSASYLIQWLEKRGLSAPAVHFRLYEGKINAWKRRQGQYMKIMGPEISSQFGAGISKTGVISLLERSYPHAPERARVLFSLFGADRSSWNLHAAFDKALISPLLPEISEVALREATRHWGEDLLMIAGISRWLFGEFKFDSYSSQWLDSVLYPCAHYGLSHPRKLNRLRTARALSQISSPLSLQILSDGLFRGIKIQELSKDELVEIGGKVMSFYDEQAMLEALDDRMILAYWLLQNKETGEDLHRKIFSMFSDEEKKTLGRDFSLQ